MTALRRAMTTLATLASALSRSAKKPACNKLACVQYCLLSFDLWSCRKVRTCKVCTLLQVLETFPDKSSPAYQYSEVLHKSFLFYFQQRSGKLPHQVCALFPPRLPHRGNWILCAKAMLMAQPSGMHFHTCARATY